MPHEYTRQRQGRDFPLHDYLTNTAAESRDSAEKNIKDDEAKKSLFGRIEEYKEEAARNSVPVDGLEPAQDYPAPERGR